jgi:hypothetical protein
MRSHDVLRRKMSQSPGCEPLGQQEPEDWRRRSWTQHFRSGRLADSVDWHEAGCSVRGRMRVSQVNVGVQ